MSRWTSTPPGPICWRYPCGREPWDTEFWRDKLVGEVRRYLDAQ